MSIVGLGIDRILSRFNYIAQVSDVLTANASFGCTIQVEKSCELFCFMQFEKLIIRLLNSRLCLCFREMKKRNLKLIGY